MNKCSYYVTLSESWSRPTMIQTTQLSDTFHLFAIKKRRIFMELPTEGKVNYCKHSVFELSRAINPESPPQKAVEVFVGFFFSSAPGRASQSPDWSDPLRYWDSSLVETLTSMSRLQIWFEIWKRKKNPKTFPQVSKSIEIFLPDLPQPHCTDDEEICWIVLSNSEHRCGLVLLTRYSGERLFIS